MKNLKYILDVGSSKMCLFALNCSNSDSVFIASASQLYDGFMDGVVQKLVAEMSTKLNTKIKQIYIGVPSEFSVCICKRKIKKYTETVKINKDLVLEMFDDANDFNAGKDFKLMSFSPMQYILDDEIKTLKPEGKRSSQISMDGSYILVKNYFVEKFDKVLHNLGINDIEYVSTILGQALMCQNGDDSLNPIAIVDIGHITSSVAIIKGEGLALLNSFSLGGGHITADIMQLLNKSYNEAEAIKRKVALTIKPKKDEKYICSINGKQISAHIQITNDIIRSRVEHLAQIIDKILDIDESFDDIPIYLTGNGLAMFKGAIEILQDKTKRNVRELKVPFDNSCDRFQTSAYGIKELVSKLI